VLLKNSTLYSVLEFTTVPSVFAFLSHPLGQDRPEVYGGGGYSLPFLIPITNYINMKNISDVWSDSSCLKNA
jgi:hypothetical protein